MSLHLIESATDLILAELKAKIGPTLEAMRSVANLEKNRGLPTPPFQEYFIARNIKAMRAPAVFVIADEIDFKKDRGANFITATASFQIAAVVEAQIMEDAARICFRYQAALQKILDNASLTTADQALRIVCIVRTGKFTEEYDPSEKPGTTSAVWRKGVLLRVDVELYEAS